MHTSERIAQSDFVYRRRQDAEWRVLSFGEAFPDYHPQDRAGLVSPRLEDGVCGAGGAVLGLATGFYDCLRSKEEVFFDYPQHHAFIGGQGTRIHTRHGDRDLTVEQMGGAWGWLDVWPETNWHLCPAEPTKMIEAIFRHQINRVFWPATFLPDTVNDPLSKYAYKLLHSRLKSVWYYDCAEPDLVVRTTGPAVAVINESMERLPGCDSHRSPDVIDTAGPELENRFKAVEPQVFLQEMAVCFTNP